jgi:hypothetical protein
LIRLGGNFGALAAMDSNRLRKIQGSPIIEIAKIGMIG